MPLVFRRGSCDPPGGSAPNPRGHNPCIFTNDSEQRVSIPRELQGIASSAYIVFQLGPFQNSLGALDVFTVHRKIQRILAQLLWGGLGTTYFTMDYGFVPFRELAIFYIRRPFFLLSLHSASSTTIFFEHKPSSAEFGASREAFSTTKNCIFSREKRWFS